MWVWERCAVRHRRRWCDLQLFSDLFSHRDADDETVFNTSPGKKAQRTFRMAVALAVFLGTLTLLIIHISSHAILSFMNTSPSVVPYALEYMHVRALGTPIVLVLNAFQGLCLGQQDTRLPMVVCGVVTALNIVLDVFLVGVRGAGARGAAVATVVAQGLGLVLMLYLVKRKQHIEGGVDYTEVWSSGGRTQRALQSSASPPSSLSSPSSPLSAPSTWDTLRIKYVPLLRTFGAMAGILIARTAAGILAYLAMSTAAMRMGIVAAAAHQIAMQTFWFLSYLPEPLSMAAQVKMAAAMDTDTSSSTLRKSLTSSTTKLRNVLLGLGAAMGVVLAATTYGAFTFVVPLFTSDPAIVAQVTALRPLGAAAIAVCSLLMVYDGISIGSGQLVHLPVGVGVGLGVVLMALNARGGLEGVWIALIGFYATRLTVHLLYYFGKAVRYRDVTTSG